MVFEPDDVGLSSQRLQRMRDAFQADIDKGIVPGVNAGCRKMVADAVRVEPVSNEKFPANREINRDIRRIRPA